MLFRSFLQFMHSQRFANLSALSTLRGRVAIVALSSVMTHTALASDIVRVDTDSGSFVLEMYADTAPVTVANFLSYVNSGAYEDTIIHRKVNNFVIQGGGFYYDPTSSDIAAISVGPAIVNEFSRSNTRGTIAMAKLGGDPNSATSQWFVNLGDNSANLDSQNGGFTVFGKVLGTGMTAADAIGALRTVNITGAMSFSDVPYLSLTGTTIADADFVNVSMSALSTSAKFGSGKLSVALNAGAIGQAWVDFTITQSSPDTVITLVPANTLFIDTTLEDMATFDAFSGTLLIPELEINGEVAYTNLRFMLTDAKSYSFTLQSFNEAP
ncbi:MAG: peptidylprolyl isomerase [OM182 bacterium]|jgi:peptidyl-prolyl cis-trans isomerase A (cyclophilin A)|nr:peptidylprolyl isomerase [OM182 bacterium]MDP4782396.1 peptidylprolyl isomerase [Gammaproteobacteria bacterium]MDP4940530.1 peptidylprolyl isomerase [OM182 bacterium]MDP5073678.1 peptidylprolyl isomerase [OM182 bacterium]